MLLPRLRFAWCRYGMRPPYANCDGFQYLKKQMDGVQELMGLIKSDLADLSIMDTGMDEIERVTTLGSPGRHLRPPSS